MRLRLDHVILRTGDPAATLAELRARAGLPVLAAVQEVAGLASAIARAGSLDLEVLRVGAAPPPRTAGYGLGFVADAPLEQASAALRELGYPTSAPSAAEADGRRWRAVQVRGLLPDPFPAPASTRPPGRLDRATAAAGALALRVPALAKAATRRPGASMVVVTEYGFDAAAWRAGAGAGREVLEVEVGTGGHDWTRLPLERGVLKLDRAGAPGVRRIVLEGEGEPFALGDVAVAFRPRCA